jgi:hypothetical protein
MMPISTQPVVVVACQVFQDLFARFTKPKAVQNLSS